MDGGCERINSVSRLVLATHLASPGLYGVKLTSGENWQSGRGKPRPYKS
ncbi:MAG: hypothetical protein LBM98_12195 [Oscillospiraceae bacterium]|nr:hypothetical protein [Oscillospiraceae bacterium]